MKKLLLLLSLTLFLASCSDDNDPKYIELTFEKNNYSLSVSNTRSIPIIKGSGDYTVSTEDNDIVKAEYKPSENKYLYGDIVIEGLKRGTATVKVTDNISGQTQLLDITITKRYLNLTSPSIIPSIEAATLSSKAAILKDLSPKLLFKGGHTVVLMGDDDGEKSNKVYVFNSSMSTEEGRVWKEGTYEFVKKEEMIELEEGEEDTDEYREDPIGSYYLVLNLKGLLSTTQYKYLIKNKSTMNSIKSFLSGETNTWNEGTLIFSPSITLEEKLTKQYKKQYKDAKNVSLQIKMDISATSPEIPLKLIK